MSELKLADVTILKANQPVQISGPRGTREQAIVKGVTRTGQIVVQMLDNTFQIVDKEDIS
jgi:biotin-(acetyl-CoA carboxylase) ligase